MFETMRYPRFILAICLGALLALTGCPGTDDNGNGNGNGNGDLCDGVTCPEGETCDPATGECVADAVDCTVDADCNDPTMECRDGDCVPKCQGITCTGGQVCEPTTGLCVDAPCTSDTDCDHMDIPNGNSEVCVDGECLGTFNSDCTDVGCDAGLDCVTLQYQDGTVANTCMQPCTGAAECPDLTFRCSDMGPGDYCEQNLCGTDGIFDQAGYTTTTWSGPCNVDGVGDGTCLGPIVAQEQGVGQLEIGLCFGNGQAAPGAACNPDAVFGDAQACDGGLCNAAEGATSGICLAFCTFLDGEVCADVGGQPQTCAWLGIGRAGVCFGQTADPSGYGETCNAEGELIDCVEDHICAALQAGDPDTCIAYCNQLSPSCPGTEQCFGFEQGENLLGICATQ